MRLLINLENTDDIREIYLESHDTVETLKYIIEAEFQIPFMQQELKYQGNPIANDKSQIMAYNIPDDDILTVNKKVLAMPNLSNLGSNTSTGNVSLSSIFDSTMKMIKTQPQQNSDYMHQMRVKSECVRLKQYYLNNPGDMSILFLEDRELAELIVSGDEFGLEALVGKRLSKHIDKVKEKQDLQTKLKNNPNDQEAREKLDEIEKWEKINENLHMAQEYFPESMSHIHMLYIPLEINKHKLTALVDTGAQMTIISEDIAKKCGVFNLCDTRYHGTAKGVGTSKILGVIHAAEIKIGDR
jgi:DNA damage-inducible protein 1